jgi:hypothetical protein
MYGSHGKEKYFEVSPININIKNEEESESSDDDDGLSHTDESPPWLPSQIFQTIITTLILLLILGN